MSARVIHGPMFETLQSHVVFSRWHSTHTSRGAPTCKVNCNKLALKVRRRGTRTPAVRNELKCCDAIRHDTRDGDS